MSHKLFWTDYFSFQEPLTLTLPIQRKTKLTETSTESSTNPTLPSQSPAVSPAKLNNLTTQQQQQLSLSVDTDLTNNNAAAGNDSKTNNLNGLLQIAPGACDTTTAGGIAAPGGGAATCGEQATAATSEKSSSGGQHATSCDGQNGGEVTCRDGTGECPPVAASSQPARKVPARCVVPREEILKRRYYGSIKKVGLMNYNLSVCPIELIGGSGDAF